MSNSSIRLLKAREALRIDESLVGLQTRVEAEQIHARTLAPVLLGPAERPTLIRLLIDMCPPGGWIGLCGVSDIGWEWAAQQGMDLGRVLVLNTGQAAHAGELCALLMDACDVVCLDLPELRRDECRVFAARARSLGHTIVTLQMWPGISRRVNGSNEIRLAV